MSKKFKLEKYINGVMDKHPDWSNKKILKKSFKKLYKELLDELE